METFRLIDTGNGSISVEFTDRYSGDNREIWELTITHGDLSHSFELETGVGQSRAAIEMADCATDFLSAFGESRDYGDPESENWDLFPDWVAAWWEEAQYNSEIMDIRHGWEL